MRGRRQTETGAFALTATRALHMVIRRRHVGAVTIIITEERFGYRI